MSGSTTGPTEPPPGVVTPRPEARVPNPDARLLFKSGFEDGVAVSDPFVQFGQQWRQELRGGDRGFAWSALPGTPANFQYLVSGNDARTPDDLKRFVETRIDTVPGHDGPPTRALFQALRAKGTIGSTQNDFIVFNMRNPDRGYVRYWIKLQPDLTDLLAENGDWRVLFEWKETPSYPTPLDFQYRWLVTLSRAQPGSGSTVDGIVWKVEGDRVDRNQSAATPWVDEWTIWNRDLPVPLGRWFLFEAHWVLHPSGEGRLLVKADGHTVADHRGRTQLTWPNGKLYLFEVYVGEQPLRRREAYQWVDDVELWSDIPYRDAETPAGR